MAMISPHHEKDKRLVLTPAPTILVKKISDGKIFMTVPHGRWKCHAVLTRDIFEDGHTMDIASFEKRILDLKLDDIMIRSCTTSDREFDVCIVFRSRGKKGTKEWELLERHFVKFYESDVFIEKILRDSDTSHYDDTIPTELIFPEVMLSGRKRFRDGEK